MLVPSIYLREFAHFLLFPWNPAKKKKKRKKKTKTQTLPCEKAYVRLFMGESPHIREKTQPS